MTTKKLIEVALPLDAINSESLRRKQKAPKGWPTSFHKWWAQRPLAAARAVIFAQMVDDPSAYVNVLRSDPKLLRKADTALKARLRLWEEACALSKKAKGTGLSVPEPGPEPNLDDVLADQERQRLFRIIEDLVLWENTNNETVLQAARDEIWQSWRRACAVYADHPQANELFDRKKLPPFLDPFAGSGSLPLSAQWLGLESYASDLNPVAVLINKATIEIPPKFAGKPPVNPEGHKSADLKTWKGAQGLAEDVRHYSQWMRDEAEKRIGHLYPKVEITADLAKARPDLRPYVGRQLTVIAWLWTRTVKSPNPAFAGVAVPLASTFVLSSKAGKEAYVEPVIENGGYSFAVKMGKAEDSTAVNRGTKLARANFTCVMSGAPISGDYIKAEARAGRMGARLMGVVAEGDRGRVYLPPSLEQERMAFQGKAEWRPELTISGSTQYLGVKPYGMNEFSQIYTERQLVALATFSTLVREARERIHRDAVSALLPDDTMSLHKGGTGATAYGDAVAVYLGCVVDRMAYYGSSLTTWLPKDNALRDCMPRQALAMTWDYAEGNPLAKSSGDVTTCANSVANYLEIASVSAAAHAIQADAQTGIPGVDGFVISTDPPYYDNVPYADLSDFFYVWLRHSLQSVLPDLFATLAVPKAEELVAFAYRHDDGKAGAEAFFLDGMTKAMRRLLEQAHPAFPVTIYYAFKQAENEGDEGTASTGWETFLEAVIRAGLAISGTWPMRTEGAGRMRATDSNALASSIILVCRPRAEGAANATRREFVAALNAELPQALAHLQRGNIAPVDLAQAAIGPGMAVYTRYSKVLDAEGKPVSVREALALINHNLDEALAEQEGDFDADSRWALTWFEQMGFAEGEYGVAEQLSKSKVTSVSGMVDAGIILSSRGKVRLLRPAELPADWDPANDSRLTAWEIVHHLIRVLASGGESAAADLVTKLGAKAEVARELCYRLYTLCERKKRADEALAYNGLVQSWPEITRLAREGSTTKPRIEQRGLFGEPEE
jgi:putative DNA methylase